jgi:hypothetical protein
MNTSVSGVAIVRSFNPTIWKLDLASSEHFRRHEPVRDLQDASRRATVHLELAGAMERAGTIDPTAALARLIVLHNPFAAQPMDLDTFGGPHDEQWGPIELVPGELAYAVVAQGRKSWEIPGVLTGDE